MRKSYDPSPESVNTTPVPSRALDELRAAFLEVATLNTALADTLAELPEGATVKESHQVLAIIAERTAKMAFDKLEAVLGGSR